MSFNSVSDKVEMHPMITVDLNYFSPFQMTYSLTRFGMYEQLKKQFPGGLLFCSLSILYTRISSTS